MRLLSSLQDNRILIISAFRKGCHMHSSLQSYSSTAAEASVGEGCSLWLSSGSPQHVNCCILTTHAVLTASTWHCCAYGQHLHNSATDIHGMWSSKHTYTCICASLDAHSFARACGPVPFHTRPCHQPQSRTFTLCPHGLALANSGQPRSNPVKPSQPAPCWLGAPCTCPPRPAPP
jgi:hypothetical protein